MKAVIYARQSSGDDETSASVETQIANCQKLAADHGLTVHGIFRDLNISGKTYPETTEAMSLASVDEAYKCWVNSTYERIHRFRRGLAEAILKLKDVDYVLLDDFTRLMRPLQNSFLESHIIQKLRASGVKIWCVKGGVCDLSSFADNLVSSLLSQINANQIEIQRRKSVEALKKLRDGGYRPTGGSFLGFRDCGRHIYQIVPEEAELVRTAFELGVRGLPYARISREMNRRSGSRRFSYDFLMAIYRRPEYAGYQFDSEGHLIVSKAFEKNPVVTLQQWSQMQQRLAACIHNHDRKQIYAFTGLCYCGSCGKKMQIVLSSKKIQSFLCFNKQCSAHSGSYVRYRYDNLSNSNSVRRVPICGEADLENPSAPEKLRHMGLHESLMPLMIRPLLEERQAAVVSEETKREMQELESQLHHWENTERQLSDKLFQGIVDDSQFAIMAKHSREEKSRIAQRLLKLKKDSSPDRDAVEKELAKVTYLLRHKRIDSAAYKKYAQKFISRIEISASRILIAFSNRKRLILERIPDRLCRCLPDWLLDVRDGKVEIRYLYKSYYSGDTVSSVIYEDDYMVVLAVGKNPAVGKKSLFSCNNNN